MLTSRPNFSKNKFLFSVGDGPQLFKFGLMISKTQLDSDVTSALVLGVCSFPFQMSRLLE